MVDPSPASFFTQTNALLRKNLTFQVQLYHYPLFIIFIFLRSIKHHTTETHTHKLKMSDLTIQSLLGLTEYGLLLSNLLACHVFLVIQKRNVKTNILLILFPLILSVLLISLQSLINHQLNQPESKCGCVCRDNSTTCNDSDKLCGVQYSDQTQMAACAIPQPHEWPPLLQLPAVYCKENVSCAFNLLFTADNQSFAQSITSFLNFYV